MSEKELTPARLAANTEKDARNRALRTAIQVFGIEVAVVVLPLSIDVLDGRLTWPELIRSAVRTFLGAAVAYVMRKKAPPPAPTG